MRRNNPYRFYRDHPAEQRAILKRLKGDQEAPEEKAMISEAIEELEGLLNERKRCRRLPSERVARKAQRSLFRRSTSLMRTHKKEK